MFASIIRKRKDDQNLKLKCRFLQSIAASLYQLENGKLSEFSVSVPVGLRLKTNDLVLLQERAGSKFEVVLCGNKLSIRKARDLIIFEGEAVVKVHDKAWEEKMYDLVYSY